MIARIAIEGQRSNVCSDRETSLVLFHWSLLSCRRGCGNIETPACANTNRHASASVAALRSLANVARLRSCWRSSVKPNMPSPSNADRPCGLHGASTTCSRTFSNGGGPQSQRSSVFADGGECRFRKQGEDRRPKPSTFQHDSRLGQMRRRTESRRCDFHPSRQPKEDVFYGRTRGWVRHPRAEVMADGCVHPRLTATP